MYTTILGQWVELYAYKNVEYINKAVFSLLDKLKHFEIVFLNQNSRFRHTCMHKLNGSRDGRYEFLTIDNLDSILYNIPTLILHDTVSVCICEYNTCVVDIYALIVLI